MCRPPRACFKDRISDRIEAAATLRPKAIAISPKSASKAFIGCSAFESVARYWPIAGSPNATAERAAHAASHTVRSRSNGKVGVHIVHLNWLAISVNHGRAYGFETSHIRSGAS